MCVRPVDDCAVMKITPSVSAPNIPSIVHIQFTMCSIKMWTHILCVFIVPSAVYALVATDYPIAKKWKK